MDKNQFFKKDALRPTEEQRLLTKPFYRNSNVIYAHFNEWKDYDRFFFIPLYLEMIYCMAGIVSELAPDPVWLGSFIRCTLEHPSLFQYKCPKCGNTVFHSAMWAHPSTVEWTWKATAIVAGRGSSQSQVGSFGVNLYVRCKMPIGSGTQDTLYHIAG